MVPLRRSAAAVLAAALLLGACSTDTPPVETAEPATSTTETTAASPTTTTTQPDPAAATPTAEPEDTAEVRVAPGSAEPINWSDCGEGFQCGELGVPADHSDPTGETIRLDVILQPASDPDARLGTLVVNPGGPGGSGVDFVRQGVPLGSGVFEVFDVVGWDPRGVGDTAPACGESLPAFYAADSAPVTPEAAAELESLGQTVAEECAGAAGSDLDKMSTTATMHDLEVLRQALGGPLNYVGFSYGTQIGLLYAETYGEELRTMALVGTVDPAQTFEQFLVDQTDAIDDAVNKMLASCAETAGCDLDDPVAAYDEMALRVRQGEFESADLGPAQLVDATLEAVYSETLWSVYLEALEAGLDGDPAPLVDRAVAYYRGGELFLSYTAISCLQEAPPPGAAYASFAADLEALSPRFGASIANELLPCAYWSVPPLDDALAVTAPAAPTILLVASTGDAITPLEWTESVIAGLEDAALILRSGEGHTQTARSACVADGLALYLIEPTETPPLMECDE